MTRSTVSLAIAVFALTAAACSDPTSTEIPLDPDATFGLHASSSNGVALECKNGGWEPLGFQNQGQCVRWVQTGKDSRPLPASCQDIRNRSPLAADGDYRIAASDREFDVYCHDMTGTPSEYLTLINTGGAFNYGQYLAGGSSRGTTVTTWYAKVRLDPAGLLVNLGDQTFANSTGSLNHSGGTPVASMPYGVAMSCSSGNGTANIDLRGTPFAVADGFQVGGSGARGSVTFSDLDQVVTLTGGGGCGWNAPAAGAYNPFNDRAGYLLNLAFTGS